MAVRHKVVTVGTVAVRLSPVQDDLNPGSELLIRNRSTGTIYLGDDTVTVAAGTPLDPNEDASFQLKRGEDDLYAIAASSLTNVRVLVVGAK